MCALICGGVGHPCFFLRLVSGAREPFLSSFPILHFPTFLLLIFLLAGMRGDLWRLEEGLGIGRERRKGHPFLSFFFLFG